MKKAVVSVTNDLVTDQRVMRTISVLQELGIQPHFVGRQLRGSLAFQKNYPITRFRLPFNKGFLFYASYNLRLFFFLLFHRFDIYISNDLDTLLPNFLVARLRNKPLIYDSHEYFTGVPEIQHRPLVKMVWTSLEKWIFPKLDKVVTVNESIADLYRKEYGKQVLVVRNISDSFVPEEQKSRAQLDLPDDKFILINQGAGINVDRGMEEACAALEYLPGEIVLLIVGHGDAIPELKKLVSEKGLQQRVIFKPKQPYQEMLQYTLNADCGLSLDKPTSPNYRFSLPNKVFDYIKCGLPLVTSSVVEVKKVVEEYGLGEVINSHEPEHIAEAVEHVRSKGRVYYRDRLQKAAQENNWEKERQVWLRLLAPYRA